jgi:ADP-ribosyl-[dinitrogen reductase] hydrolase
VTGLLSGDMGTPRRPLNDSKGCGGVMRVAPVGLVAADPFELGCKVAAITHGHPSGWLAAGAFAQIISAITRGDSIRSAAEGALDRCREMEDGSEVTEAMHAALTMADRGLSPTPERVELLGAGWVAEEALAISLFCAVGATNTAEAMAGSVSHGGDSDSTGSLTGNLLGAALGVDWLDDSLLAQLEGRSIIEQVGSDLYDAFVEPHNGVRWERYPSQ